MAKKKKVSLRTCIGCGEVRQKHDLVRVVRTAEGKVMVDSSGKVGGRGVYFCFKESCLADAIKKKKIARSLCLDEGLLPLDEIKQAIMDCIREQEV